MAKRKNKNNKRKDRRKQEALKAQKRSVLTKPVMEAEMTKPKKSQDKYALPVKEIKKDLAKIVLFATLSVTLLFILQNKGVSFTSLFPHQ